MLEQFAKVLTVLPKPWLGNVVSLAMVLSGVTLI